MKFLLAILFIASLKADVNECILGIRIYPYKYIGATQTIEGKFEFKSNCLEFASMNFFILPYDKNYELSKDTHPQRIILSIFGKAFQFDYSEPRKTGNAHNLNILYQKVRMSPSVITQRISTMKENNLILRTSNGAGFDKDEIESLFYKKNPCLCQLDKNKQTMLCRI